MHALRRHVKLFHELVTRMHAKTAENSYLCENINHE